MRLPRIGKLILPALLIPTSVLWAWSYKRALIWQPSFIPGWRIAADRGSVLIDDQPAIAEATAVRNRLVGAHERYSRWRVDSVFAFVRHAQPRNPRQFFTQLREMIARDRRTALALGQLPPTSRLNMPSLGFLTALLALACSPPLFRAIASRMAVQAGRCPNCRYDLTANTSGICPECGHPTSALHPAWTTSPKSAMH